MNAYAEKQQSKKERYQQLADKNEQKSKDLWSEASASAAIIPLGQPILVNHYSEKKHRKHLEHIDNKSRQSIEVGKKSEYYQRKVDSIENSNVISSDDPEALDKLKNKLEGLKEIHASFIAHNKQARKEGTERLGSYILTNSNARIRSVKIRIKSLESIQKLETHSIIINNIEIKMNVEINRIQLFFVGRPSMEIRKQLKSSGFRWSPKQNAWQRNISNGAVYAAKQIVKNY